MATPIEPTPILKGKDKELFLKDVENPLFSPEKAKLFRECDELFRKAAKDF